MVEKNILGDQTVLPDATSPLMVVADLSSVWVIAELFEADAIDLREGAKAEITSPSNPDLRLLGTVDMVSAIVDPNRHTVPIRCRVANQDPPLRPNAYARVKFAYTPKAESVEIPASALITDGARQYVYVRADGGEFVRREVVVGATTGGKATILSGLAPDGEVVVEGILLDNLVSAER